jgi:LPXTG-site transpeptidase (sortase) family protein
MTRKEIVKFIVLRSIGNFLLLFAIFGVFATFGPVLYYEAQYQVMQYRGIKYTVIAGEKESGFGKIVKSGIFDKRSSESFASVLTGPKEQILIPKDTEFDILIPKIGANAKVFPNVDSSDQNNFLPILMQGVAHSRGTVFPGMNGNIYLFAHSTDNFWDVGRYNAIFYLLKNLERGDDVIIFFQGVRHNYKVTDKKTVEASDVSYIVNGQNQPTETLILQTCWPPGTTWERLLVFAKPVGD